MSISRLAYYLALIGGILLVVFGLLGVFQSTFRGLYVGWGLSYGGIVSLICGIIAVIAASRNSDLVWAIVLVVIGIIGGGLGGLLVLLGGILGLIAALSHRA
jgi:hypothetical protein